MGFSIKLDSYTSIPLNLGEITISIVYIRTKEKDITYYTFIPIFFFFGADIVSIVDCRHASDKKV